VIADWIPVVMTWFWSILSILFYIDMTPLFSNQAYTTFYTRLNYIILYWFMLTGIVWYCVVLWSCIVLCCDFCCVLCLHLCCIWCFILLYCTDKFYIQSRKANLTESMQQICKYKYKSQFSVNDYKLLICKLFVQQTPSLLFASTGKWQGVKGSTADR
jgi:hypothetical protein